MPEEGNENKGQDSSLSARVAKVTAIVLALTALVTALVHFRDSIPWLTPVAKIELTPDPVNLDIGDKIQIVAAVKDSDGKALSKRVIWTSANPELVMVEGDGFVTAGQSAGRTTITATVGPVKGVAQVHVRRVSVATVEVFPPTMTLQVGDHLKFDATPYDSERNSLLGRPVRWSSDNNAVASVDETSGDAVGKAVGSVKLTAESGGKFNTAPITVNPKPVSEVAEVTQPPATATAPSPSPGGTADTPVRGAERVRGTAAIGALATAPRRAESESVRPPVAERPPQAPTHGVLAALNVVAAQKITIVGGVKTAECPASVRILIGESLVDLRSDPQEVGGLPGGDQSYNLHGTVACPGQVVAVVNGRGTVNIANQKTYRCRWKRIGRKNFEVTLEAE